MKWRTIRWMILVLLLLANGILALVLRSWNQGPGEATPEQLLAVQTAYQKQGIAWPEALPAYQPAVILELQAPVLETYVWNLMGEERREVYLYDSRVQYIKGQDSLILDYSQNSITYYCSRKDGKKTDLDTARAAAEAFLKQLTGTSEFVLQKEEERTANHYFSYCEKWDGKPLPFNTAELWVDEDGVHNARYTAYSVASEASAARQEYPMDELLYRGLNRLEKQETPVTQLVSVSYGYRLEETETAVRGIPCLVLQFDGDVRLELDRVPAE